MAKLVGFTGYKETGKSTAGQFLVEQGFTRLGFADKLKEAVANLFGISIQEVEEFKEKAELPEDDICVMIGDYGGMLHTSLTWRGFLQRFGTEMGRETFGWDFWIEQALPDFPRQDTVITDVRFDNEAARIIRFGGTVIQIIRPGYESDGHESEQGIDPDLIDATIVNDGSLEKFKGLVLSAALIR